MAITSDLLPKRYAEERGNSIRLGLWADYNVPRSESPVCLSLNSSSECMKCLKFRMWSRQTQRLLGRPLTANTSIDCFKFFFLGCGTGRGFFVPIALNYQSDMQIVILNSAYRTRSLRKSYGLLIVSCHPHWVDHSTNIMTAGLPNKSSPNEPWSTSRLFCYGPESSLFSVRG